MNKLLRRSIAAKSPGMLTMLYWTVDQRIHRDAQGGKRADYGKRIVASLGRQLAAEFSAGFDALRAYRYLEKAGGSR